MGPMDLLTDCSWIQPQSLKCVQRRIIRLLISRNSKNNIGMPRKEIAFIVLNNVSHIEDYTKNMDELKNANSGIQMCH